jgi:high-affinity nickel-transport protein
MQFRIFTLFGLLIAANLAAWAWALLAFGDRPLLLAPAALAWGLGLRHAVDADHIAAIDNATRKLVADGGRPLTVGLFFALGHSAVVTLVVAGVVAVGSFGELGSLLGTLVSGLFLLAIAAVNLVILRQTWHAFRHAGPDSDAAPADTALVRFCRPLFALIRRPWHMAPLGFLFGLGFDTATEVSLLGLSASQAAQGLPLWSILVFPALFAAGMALVDTADGVLMLGAYGWMTINPRRKLAYNLTITGASVLVAVGVGGLELLGLAGERWGLSGRFWDTVGALNEHANALGFAIVAVFALAWLGALAAGRYMALDERDAPADAAD